MPRKVKISGSVSQEAADYVAQMCEAFDRRPPYVIERAILFAKNNGLDLSCGEARQMASALNERRNAS